MLDMKSVLNAPVTCDPTDREQLLQDILASQYFRKSPRLREFLSYICERAFAHRFDEISEAQIAVHVFGRPPDYNAAEDTIVRTAARQLRKKLELYNLSEGAASAWRLTIPKGSYIPFFESNNIPAMAAPATSEDGGERSRTPRWPRRTLAVAAAAALLIWGGVTLAEMMDPHAIFWRAVLPSTQATQLVSGDSGFAMLQYQTHRAIHVREYAAGKFVPQPSGTAGGADGDMLASFGWHRYTSAADLVMVAKTTSVADKIARKLDVKFARDISLRDLKAGNVILVGGPSGNPWVELFSAQLNFDFQIDANNSAQIIANRAPLGQEEAVYRAYPGDPTNRAYAVIALTNGLEGHGRTLLVEGTSVAGTDAAVDFLFNSDRFADVLKSAIHLWSIDNFEVLLETENVAANGTQMKVIGVRVHPR